MFRYLAIFLSFLYFTIVFKLTILLTDGPYNSAVDHLTLVPLSNTYRYVYAALKYGSTSFAIKEFCRNCLGNILLFVPLGILLPVITKSFYSASRVFFVAVTFSITIEVVQYVLSRYGVNRFADIDDVILNTMGAAIGFYLHETFRSGKLHRLLSKLPLPSLS